jgi:subtilisin family serine protease
MDMGEHHRRAPGRLGAGVVCALAGLGLVAAACQPVAAPPPPPPASCDSASQATPTPQHPVSYAAVVRHPGWAAPQATSFTATSEADKDAQIAQLQSTGTVLAVGPNQILKAQTDPPVQTANFPFFGLYQWGLRPAPGADFPPAWGLGYSGGGERIAVVDTGVDLAHQGLAGRVVAGPDYVAGGTVTGDPDGHGTHVAGIIADADTSGGLGGAPNATIVAVRVLNQAGDGSDVAVANGIIWAATTGHANVINLSLGAAGCDAPLQAAMQIAWNDGVVVVAAAGNDGSNELFSPAGYTNEAIAVAATDDSGNKASFSNDGGFVSIAAPGQGILSTCGWTPACIEPEGGTSISSTAYGYLSGTSMATPFVSAAAALVKEECPGFSASQIKAELVNHAGATVPGFAFHELDAGAAVTAHCT